MLFAVLPVAVCQGLSNQIHSLFKKTPTRARSCCASGHGGRSLAFHHLAYLVFEHTFDFILHCLGASFAEMRPHPVSDVVNLLDQRGWCFWDGAFGDCRAGIVGHRLSFQTHQNGYNCTHVKNSSLAIIRPPTQARDRRKNSWRWVVS